MSKTLVFVVIALILIGAGVVLGVFNLGNNKSQSTSDNITYQNIENEVNSKKAIVLDVRTPSEYSSGHFNLAENLPLQSIQTGNYPNVAKEYKIFLYCASGNRSRQATDLLIKAGYSNIVDLHGLSAVESIGGKLVTN